MTADSRKDPAYEKNIISRIPASRWATPDDYQGVVIFLASQASDFITGTGIVVDGGLLGGPSISNVS
jgi:2-deoxy-D-gluconate 3-dehydrogenase